MKTTCIYTLLCTLCLYGIMAQTPYQIEKGEGDHERLKNFQMEYLNKLLILSDEKKEQLFLLLDKHQKKIKALHKAFKPNREKLRELKSLSDEQAKKIFQEIKTFELRKFTLRNKMLDELDGILSPQQKLQFIRAKMDFRSKLLKHSYKKRHRDKLKPHPYSE